MSLKITRLDRKEKAYKREGAAPGSISVRRHTFGAMVVLAVIAVGLVTGRNATRVNPSQPDVNSPYIFYGYTPPNIVNYTALVGTTVVHNYTRFPSRLDVVGINDSIRVEIYDLTSRRLIASKTVNRMELWTVYLGTKEAAPTPPRSEETYFKVVSDKLVAVSLSGGPGHPWLGGGWNGGWVDGSFLLYPSTDGGFSGKEFIFMATNTTWKPDMYLGEHGVYHIFGVEPGHVTVFDAAGARVAELDAPAGSFNKISLRTGSVYRLVSTGRVLVAGMSDDAFKYLPSLTGGFVGKHFVGTLLGQTQEQARESILVIAHEDAEVSVYDVTRPGFLIGLSGPDVRKSLRAGELWFNSTMRAGIPIRVDSTGDISVLMGKGTAGWGAPGAQQTSIPENLGDDISFAGAKAGESFSFYAPTQAVVFAPQDMTVEIDGVAVAMSADEYVTLLTGQHTVRGTAPVIVEVVGQGVRQVTWSSWGGYLISPQSLEAAYPEPPSIGGLGALLPIIGIGVAVPVIVIAVVLIRRRPRKAHRE